MSRLSYRGSLVIGSLLYGLVLLALFGFLASAILHERMSTTVGILVGLLGVMLGPIFSAWLTTYQCLSDQETTTREAIRIEVASFQKRIEEAINAVQIAEGAGSITPDRTVLALSSALIEPVVYPAVAGRVAMLQNSREIITFFALLAELRLMMGLLLRKRTDAGPVTGDSSDLLARECDSVIVCLNLANAVSQTILCERQ